MSTLANVKSQSSTTVSIDARWIALGLFIVTVLLRIPFASQYLYHWDSVNMAFGMLDYNVLEGAPQFPGYIVYIAIAQAVNLLFNDPQTTMVIISMVSAGLATVTIFFLGRDMFNQTTGLIAAVFLMSSPLVWFYSEIALPHTLDLFVIILSAWLLYRIMQGDTRLLWGTAVFLALVGGFRQQNLLFLGPLILFALWPHGILKIILFAAVGFVTTLLWFIPLMGYSGGLDAYLAGSSAFSAQFWSTTSLLHGGGLFGLQRNLIKLIPYTAYAWSLAALPALYWLTQIPSRWRSWLRSRKAWFMLLWVTPTLAFYIIIHMGQQGLVFVFLPAFILMSAAGLDRLLAGRQTLLQAAVALVFIVNAGVFILAPSYPLGTSGPKILTYSTLQENDAWLSGVISTVRSNFDPDHTVLASSNWRFVEYYLPEYQLNRFNVGARWELAEGQLIGAEGQGAAVSAADLGLAAGEDWQLVFVDPELEALTDAPLETVTGPDGLRMAYLPLAADEAFIIDGAALRVVAAD